MKALELSGFFDDKGLLKLDKPLKIINQRVKVIILIPDNDEMSDADWLQAISQNPAFDFLHDKEEDIYSLADGEPMTDEV
ncbi:MAG: hypothetical protein D6730_08880 [Bacteroidetes bacterium]|nr:MAG: hypothetical protein D6730_08880 [Bacteroidota bacterium]